MQASDAAMTNTEFFQAFFLGALFPFLFYGFYGSYRSYKEATSENVQMILAESRAKGQTPIVLPAIRILIPLIISSIYYAYYFTIGIRLK